MPNLLTSRRILRPFRPFRPDQVQGLALWLDASDAATLTLDGSGNISQWNDKSGNARHLTQSNTTLRPSYTSASQINGITVPKFDGTDDRMTSSFATIPQPVTAFAVCRSPKIATLAGIQVIFDGRAVPTHAMFFLDSIARVNAGSNLDGGTVSANVPILYAAQFSGSSSLVRINGSQTGSGNAGSGSLTNGITIGADRDGNSRLQGDIAEIAYYSRLLTAGEITQVESYLKAKWGTP